MLTVQDVLDRKGREVATIDSHRSVLEAAEKMNERHIGSLVVTSGDRVIGIFTERDILRRVVAAGKSPTETRVAEVMSAPTACCRRRTTLAECRSIMTQRRIRHLPVVEDGNLLGIISAGDLMAIEAIEQQTAIEFLHEYMFGRV